MPRRVRWPYLPAIRRVKFAEVPTTRSIVYFHGIVQVVTFYDPAVTGLPSASAASAAARRLGSDLFRIGEARERISFGERSSDAICSKRSPSRCSIFSHER